MACARLIQAQEKKLHRCGWESLDLTVEKRSREDTLRMVIQRPIIKGDALDILVWPACSA